MPAYSSFIHDASLEIKLHEATPSHIDVYLVFLFHPREKKGHKKTSYAYVLRHAYKHTTMRLLYVLISRFKRANSEHMVLFRASFFFFRTR